MYDLMEVKAYKPNGNYKIGADAYRDGGKDELIAVLDAIETEERREKLAKWRSIILTFTKLIAPSKQVPSGRSAISR